jgi:hypothetical protein
MLAKSLVKWLLGVLIGSLGIESVLLNEGTIDIIASIVPFIIPI